MADTGAPKKSEPVRVATGRGPAYASISLRDAVRRVAQIKDANAARASLSPDTIFRIWGFKGASGASRPVMASVGYYGLLEPVGRGDDRKSRLSELALRIVLDKLPNSSERVAALQEAALRPNIHERLWGEYGTPLPADVIIERFLVRDCDYSEAAADTILKVYKDTLDFAGLDKPADMPENGAEPEVAAPAQKPPSFFDDVLGGMMWPKREAAMPQAAQQPVRQAPPAPPALPEVAAENELRVALDGDRIRVSAFVDLAGARRLQKRLEANIALLEEEAAQSPAPIPARQEPQATTGSSATASVPFMITNEMKAKLRAIGVTDEKLHHMTPEEAHTILSSVG